MGSDTPWTDGLATLQTYFIHSQVVSSRLQTWLYNHLDTYGFDAIRVDAARHISSSFLADIQNHGRTM